LPSIEEIEAQFENDDLKAVDDEWFTKRLGKEITINKKLLENYKFSKSSKKVVIGTSKT
jgi:hypothetical protein